MESRSEYRWDDEPVEMGSYQNKSDAEDVCKILKIYNEASEDVASLIEEMYNEKLREARHVFIKTHNVLGISGEDDEVLKITVKNDIRYIFSDTRSWSDSKEYFVKEDDVVAEPINTNGLYL